MPTPEGLNVTTLHGKFVQPDALGTPLQGTISFTTNPAVVIFPTENILVEGSQSVTLDANGEFTLDLISTDQAGENPTGWTYSVNEKINGQKPRTYLIALPYNNGVTVELSDIIPTDAAPNYIPVIGPTGAPGSVTEVNGHTTAVIDLVAADLPDLIPMTQRAAANGVATLDAGTKVPVAQLPDLTGTYVPWANVEVANGVASLDASAKIKSTELNLAASAPPSVGTGAVGTSTNLARQDHTHDGVDLVNAQTIAGAKNFSTSVQAAQLGVGVAPGTQRAHIKSTVDEVALQVEQTTVTGTNTLLLVVGFDNTMTAFGARVSGDTVGRVALKTSGNIEFGPGNAARDTTLYRSSTGNLNSNQFNADAAAPTAASHLTRKDYVDNNFSSLAGAQTVSGTKTYTSNIIVSRSTAASTALQTQVSGDTQPRLIMGADGKLSWGPGGSTATDTTFYRSAASTLKTDNNLVVGNQLTVGTSALYVIQDWQNLTAIGSFANGAAAGTQVPRVRKVMFFGRELWEMEGQIALSSWTGGTIYSFTGGSTSGWAPSQEHNYSLAVGAGSSATGSMRGYWNGSGNVGIAPTPSGTVSYIYAEQLRIMNPLAV